ncbi:MAG TPA: ubiquinol-cytochrome c reductase iron-sulfur subunit [Thermoanaerobaculia bacterium]|nr:ubiquinol-cytochrome c reductase iron-sulfur subunit [Thermoanaerobaculia bacterium]
MNRRQMLNWFLGTSIGALIASVIYPVLRYMTPPKITEASTNQIEAGEVNDPQLLERGYKIVRFGAEPVILVKAADNDFRAFSATCTHLDCIVGFQKEQTRIYCNCHGGCYDLQGRNVSGPPPRPLTPYKVNVVAKGSGPGLIVVSKA